MLNRSWPRSTTSLVIWKGNVDTSSPLTFPVKKCSSVSMLLPRAIVPSTGAREARRSSKKLLISYGSNFGWSCISCRQAVTAVIQKRQIRPRPVCLSGLRFNFRYLMRVQVFQKLFGFVRVEFGVIRFDTQEKTILRCILEPRHIEDRMIGAWKAVHQ